MLYYCSAETWREKRSFISSQDRCDLSGLPVVSGPLHVSYPWYDEFPTTERTVVSWLLLECLTQSLVPAIMIFPDSQRNDRSGDLQA